MMAQREIEIHRNPIEKGLMVARDFIKHNRRTFIYGTMAVVGVVFLAIGAYVYLEYRAGTELIKFETIVDEYQKQAAFGPELRAKACEDAAGKLRPLISSSWTGYVHTFGWYYLGGMYFENKRFADAKECYLKFGNASSSEVFAPLALQQAARCAEMLNDLKGAQSIYADIERRFGTSDLADQILYDIARLHQRGGDIFKAREYYNKIIVGFPQSLYAKKAKEGLFLLGYYEGRKKSPVK